MNTILISGNDTNIGKTWVCRALAQYLAMHNQGIQVIKIVETGVSADHKSDAETAIEGCSSFNGMKCQAFTLYSFPDPLAPVTAAYKMGCKLSLESIIYKMRSLPETDWRILETAGGLAVPLEETGLDSVNLALNLPVDYLVLVVQNRLGTIHQARVLASYAPYLKIKTGLWFNDTIPTDSHVTFSNYSELANLPISIWGHQQYQAHLLQFFDSFPIAHYFVEQNQVVTASKMKLAN